MKIGQAVMLVGTDGSMPPMGAVGVIVGPLDHDGDHEVDFPAHPCPVGGEETWFVPARWLMPLDDPNLDAVSIEDEAHVRQ